MQSGLRLQRLKHKAIQMDIDSKARDAKAIQKEPDSRAGNAAKNRVDETETKVFKKTSKFKCF